MRKCPRCGARNDDEAPVCSLCGNTLAAARSEGARSAGKGGPPASGPLIEPRLWQAGKPRRAAPKKATDERHYLVPPFGEVLRLEVGSDPLVLGRDEDCEIRIASPTVSRRHAEIAFEGGPAVRARLKDLGTKNGTRVNGEPVEAERVLEDRDVIRLGDVTAIYRVLPAGTAESSLNELPVSTAKMEDGGAETAPAGAGAQGGSGGLNGDIAYYPIVELFGRLGKLRAQGTLHVEVDGVKGSAVLAGGSVKKASFGGLEGPGAVQTLSELRRGQFWFEPAKT